MDFKKLKGIAITTAVGVLKFFGDILYKFAGPRVQLAFKKLKAGVATMTAFGADPSVRLVFKINRTTDYYQILGLRKKCSAEEIRKAYKKISLMVHPDKNKVYGSEEAFKKVNKAYQCLIDERSRKSYDARREKEPELKEVIFFICIMLTIIALIFVSALCLDIALKDDYSIQMHREYQLPKMTTEYRIEFYVESLNKFDEKYPLGSRERADIENTITKDYLRMLRQDCDYEQHRRSLRRDFPTSQCDKLQSLGMHEQG